MFSSKKKNVELNLMFISQANDIGNSEYWYFALRYLSYTASFISSRGCREKQWPGMSRMSWSFFIGIDWQLPVSIYLDEVRARGHNSSVYHRHSGMDNPDVLKLFHRHSVWMLRISVLVKVNGIHHYSFIDLILPCFSHK